MVPEEIAPKPDTYSLRPVVMGKGGMFVAGTPLAAQAGARILTRGEPQPMQPSPPPRCRRS